MFKTILALILSVTAYAADYTKGIQYGYGGDDKFDTLIKQHKLTVGMIRDFKGEGIDEDDAGCKGRSNEYALFSFLVELMAIHDGKTLLEYAYGAAQQIRAELAKYEPSLIVGIGRSPFMVIDMIQEILRLDDYKGPTQVKHMAYSGSPDVMLMRRTDYNVLGNVMVPRRVKVIFDYFDELGFDKADKGIWFVDIMGYGSGKNALFRLLREYYKLKEIAQPPIHFFMLFDENDSFDFCERHFFYDHAKHKLSFSKNFPATGIRPMTVPTTILTISSWLIDFMDIDQVAMRCAPVQQYRPFTMKAESKLTRSQPAPMYAKFSQAIKNAVSYLRGHRDIDRADLCLLMVKVLENTQFLNDLLIKQVIAAEINQGFLIVEEIRDAALTHIINTYLNHIDKTYAATKALAYAAHQNQE